MDEKVGFNDVLVTPQRSSVGSRSDVDLIRKFTFKHSGRSFNGIPVIASNTECTGTFAIAEELSKYKLFTCISKYYMVADWVDFAQLHPESIQFTAVTSGVRTGDVVKLKAITESVPGINCICLDVANGYTNIFREFVCRTRKVYPHFTIMAGNVATPEVALELVHAGADVIKIGVGSGSVCSTRMKTGVGIPQLSAILDCAEAVHGIGAQIISDGGCTCPGDVAKSFGAGSDFVMIGGMFAGHDESAGDLVERDGKKYKSYYGMASSTAMAMHADPASYRAAEGDLVELPYRGPIKNTVLDLLGGLRSTCSYVGAKKLSQLQRKTVFVRVSRQHSGMFEAFRKLD